MANRYKEALSGMCCECEMFGAKCANIYKGRKCDDYETLQELIERTTPKKPRKLTYDLLIKEGWVYECPNCGSACGENKYHAEVTTNENYCPNCGHAIDWSEEE